MSRAPVSFPLTPASRALPAGWNPVVDAAARAHAHEVFPQEAAGILEGGYYVRLDNVSPTPDENVGLSDADRLRVLAADAFFHSHPNGHACPSQADMQFQYDIGKPCVIYVPDTNDLFAWGDMLAAPPLVGRAFRHGICDCYGAIRDWYVEHRGVLLPEGIRGWDWWSTGQNLYADNFRRAGFQMISVGDATQPSDLVLFKFNYAVWMHAAVVHDRDLLFHHTAGRLPYDPTRLSGFVPRHRWIRLAAGALRFAP